MKLSIIIGLIAVSMIMWGGCQQMKQEVNVEAEKAAVEKIIRANIGWAATKDATLLYSTVAHNDDLFWFSPTDRGTIKGYEAFKNLTTNFFMLDDFKAVNYELRDLAIGISPEGDAAWWHCRLDDFNTWKGQPADWEDARWTGVLVKQGGNWVIVQMHFSFATDRPEK
jgi:hypothetical protein